MRILEHYYYYYFYYDYCYYYYYYYCILEQNHLTCQTTLDVFGSSSRVDLNSGQEALVNLSVVVVVVVVALVALVNLSAI